MDDMKGPCAAERSLLFAQGLFVYKLCKSTSKIPI